MQKALMIYASMSGNTEDIAGIIKETLSGHQIAVDCLDMDEADADSLKAYDYVFVGTYTWGDGDLPYEAEDFYEDILHSQLNGLKTACFGSGDHAYPKFCEAVTLFCDAFEQAGAILYPETLKIELAPETAEDQECCKEFVRGFLAWAAHHGDRCHVS